MALFEIKMPKMGESIEEATITKWFVKEGDQVQEDDVLLEIATDKVDSEIPSPVAGKVSKILLPKFKLLFYMVFYLFNDSRHQKQPPPKVMVCKFMGVDSFAAHYSVRP